MSKSPFVAMYSSDYLADTAHLGLTEHGVYWRMLLHYYQHESPLPGDIDKICRIIMAVAPEERRTVDFVLSQYFTFSQEPTGDVWRHKRADKEIAEAAKRREANTKRAKAGAAGRWPKDGSDDA